ncbi:hypothetical protein BDV10DRAFT_189662 [Aspergillus recurvatus]
MPPFKPRHVSAGKDTIQSFGGILTTEFLEPPPGRGFCFRQTYRANLDGPVDEKIQRVIDSNAKPSGPPPHLHRYQTEYFKVERGLMGVNINGTIYKKTPADPEFSVPANEFHGFFRHPDGEGPMTVVLSASDSGREEKLDRVFFENWYGYWHDATIHHGGMNYIQWLQIYDAGDAYPYMPAWIPFRKTVAYCWGVAVGRWLGGMLGYCPFFAEYTTDWDQAVAKMETHFWQRRRLRREGLLGKVKDLRASVSSTEGVY